ncbi:MAG: hypothetical protein ACK5KO_02835 [Arachnia sp.]
MPPRSTRILRGFQLTAVYSPTLEHPLPKLWVAKRTNRTGAPLPWGLPPLFTDSAEFDEHFAVWDADPSALNQMPNPSPKQWLVAIDGPGFQIMGNRLFILDTTSPLRQETSSPTSPTRVASPIASPAPTGWAEPSARHRLPILTLILNKA